MNKLKLLLGVFSVCSTALVWAEVELADRLKSIDLPTGFEIALYAQGVENSRQLALGKLGTVFAGSRSGKVHAIVDSNGNHQGDQVYLIAQGLKLPLGTEFKAGALYVSALDRILRYDDIESQLEHPPEPEVIVDGLPGKTRHGGKYLRFGPDELLYVPIGAPCNICDEEGFAQVRRLRADGSGVDVYARGLRNSVGLAFHPETGELWLTDNGRDMLGDDLPADELNHAPRAGMHFGYPWCHQGDILDEKFGEGKSCSDYTPPAQKLGAHVAALGLTFYNGDMFPQSYRNQLFIAQHGSWNRSEKTGYNILLVRFDDNARVIGTEIFASGWLQGDEAWGRPNDILQMPDGSLLVSDDRANAIYRISYKKP